MASKKKQLGIDLWVQRSAELQKLMRILKNRYSYSFVNEQQEKTYAKVLPFRYMETIVSEYGRAAIYKDKNAGYAIYKAVLGSGYDIYGRPQSYDLYTYNGTNLHQVDADDENLIILQDDFNGIAFKNIAMRYANILGKILESANTNITAMRTPYLIQSKKDSMQSVKEALLAAKEEPEIVVDDRFVFDEVMRVLDLKVPNNLPTLEDEYTTRFAKFLEEIGFTYRNIDKKERLVADEAEDDKEVLIAFDNEPFQNRLQFIKDMKEKFGIELELIKANAELYEKEEKSENE